MFREMKNIISITGKGWRFIFLLLLRAPFDIAYTTINALFLQQAFNAIEQGDNTRLIYVCLAFGIASLCLFMYNGTIWSIYAPFTTRLEGKLRARLFEKIASFSYQHIEAAPQGQWVTQLNTDVEMPFSRNFTFPHTACAVVNITVSAFILWRINPAIFGWVMLFVIPHILFSQLAIARAMPSLHTKSLEETATNTSEMAAIITCADVAALYNGQDYLMNRFEKSSMNLLRVNMKIHARSALGAGVVPLFGLGGYLLLLFVSSRWIAAGQFTFGDLTAAFQFRGGVLLGSLMLINCIITIQGSMAGIRRINKTIDNQVEQKTGVNIWRAT